MNTSDTTNWDTSSLLELVLLSALWGGSFLLLRLTSNSFGPVFLIEMRVLSGLAVVLPFVLLNKRLRELIANWRIIALISLTNMCIPFCLLAFASINLGAGTISILNATVPFFAAITGLLFFREKVSTTGLVGLVVGFTGVVFLMNGEMSGMTTPAGGLAFVAGLLAATCYGFSAHVINRHLMGISGLVITAGSLAFSSLYLAPIALLNPPTRMPELDLWLAVILLGTLCTGLPYVIFYRLILKVGAYQSLTVTYLVPVFSMVYGSLLLSEEISPGMLAGGALVLAGVAITTGRLRMPLSPK